MNDQKFSIDGRVKSLLDGDTTYDWKKERLAKTPAYHRCFIELQIKDGNDKIIRLELDEKDRGYSIGWKTNISFEEFFKLVRILYGQRTKQQNTKVDNTYQGGIYVRYPSKVASDATEPRELVISIAKGEEEKPDYPLETFLENKIIEIFLPKDEEYSIRICTAFFGAHYTDNNQGEKTIAFASQFNMAKNLTDLFAISSTKRYELWDKQDIEFILERLLGSYPS